MTKAEQNRLMRWRLKMLQQASESPRGIARGRDSSVAAACGTRNTTASLARGRLRSRHRDEVPERVVGGMRGALKSSHGLPCELLGGA